MFQIQNLIECERAIRGTETQFDPKLIVALEAVQDRIEQECYRGEIDQNLISSQDSTPGPCGTFGKSFAFAYRSLRLGKILRILPRTTASLSLFLAKQLSHLGFGYLLRKYPGRDSNGVGIVPRLRLRYDPYVTYGLGGGHSAYIGHLASVWGGNPRQRVDFFTYAILLAANWCKFGVSRGGVPVTVVNEINQKTCFPTGA
jgi:hypothetical protein